jgi:dTDP-4-dehydrorhamnose 3,5-epimerase
MKITRTDLDGVVLIDPHVFDDTRGFFMESHHHGRYSDADISRDFIQDNLSFSTRNTLRGLHFQLENPQAKLVQVITGEIFDVAVDIRLGSPTFKKWVGVRLSEENHRQIFIPEGFAHGFCVLSPSTHVLYKCSDIYAPDDQCGLIWSDPDIGIAWPVREPILSEKDQLYPSLSDLTPDRLFKYTANP